MARALSLEEMRLADLTQVLQIERQSFPEPWSLSAFVAEFRSPGSRRIVARAHPGGPVLGYCIALTVLTELHIQSVAVDPRNRGQGVGEALVRKALASTETPAEATYLEVRPSNRAARSLYAKLGFLHVGVRAGYYGNGEDAWIYRRDRRPGEASP